MAGAYRALGDEENDYLALLHQPAATPDEDNDYMALLPPHLQPSSAEQILARIEADAGTTLTGAAREKALAEIAAHSDRYDLAPLGEGVRTGPTNRGGARRPQNAGLSDLGEPTLGERNDKFNAETTFGERLSGNLERGWLNLKSSVIGALFNPQIERGAQIEREGDVTYDSNIGPINASTYYTDDQLPLVLEGERAKSAAARQALAAHVAPIQAELGAIPQRPATQAMQQAHGFREALSALGEDPLGVIGDIGVSSGVQMAPALAVTAATRNPGIAAAAFGGSSALNEYGSGVLDYLSRQGVDVRDPKSIEKALQDPKTVERAMEYAKARAAIVGTADTISGGLASKSVVPAALVRNELGREAANVLVAQPALQAALGAGGEAAAQEATTAQVNAGDVLAEAVGETFTAPVEASVFAADRAHQARTGRVSAPALGDALETGPIGAARPSTLTATAPTGQVTTDVELDELLTRNLPAVIEAVGPERVRAALGDIDAAPPAAAAAPAALGDAVAPAPAREGGEERSRAAVNQAAFVDQVRAALEVRRGQEQASAGAGGGETSAQVREPIATKAAAPVDVETRTAHSGAAVPALASSPLTPETAGGYRPAAEDTPAASGGNALKVEAGDSTRTDTAALAAGDDTARLGASQASVARPVAEPPESTDVALSRGKPDSGSALGGEELGAASKGRVFGGRAPEAVQAHIDRVTGAWKGAPAIRAHASASELPQALQAEAKRQGVPLEEIVAAWHDGEVHLVGSHPNLSTEQQVEGAIYHEAHGHFGMRQVMGKDLRPFLIKLSDDMGGVTGLMKEARKNGVDLSDYEAATRDNPNVSRVDRLAMLAEELGAHIAEQGTPALRRRLTEYLGAAKAWLREHGFPGLSTLSDVDLANLLRRARNSVVHGAGGGKSEGGTMFQRAAAAPSASPTESAASTEADEEARFARARPLTQLQRDALAKAGLAVDDRSRLTRVRDWLKDETAKARAALQDPDARRQALVDRFHGLRAAESRAGGLDPRESAYLAARNTTGLASVMESVLRYGAPEWRDGVLNYKPGTKGLLDALKPIEGDIDDWLGWMVGRRAELMAKQGRENNLAPSEIQALLSLANGKEPAFKQAALDYLKLKNAILDVAEQAGIIDPLARAAWDHAEYIPFYRDEAGDTVGPGTRKGLEGQSSGIRTLKGGTAALHDPLANIVRNFTKLMDASMKNHAVLLAVDKLPGEFGPAPMQMEPALIPLDQVRKHLEAQGVSPAAIAALPSAAIKGVRRMLSITAPTAEDVVRVMRAGKPEYRTVKDPLLLRALTAFKQVEKNPAVKPFIFAKRLLTFGVTVTPEFLGANFLRDSGASWVIADDRFIPGWSSLKGLYNTLRKDPATLEMMMAGSSFMGGQYYAGDADAAAESLRRSLRAKGVRNQDLEGFVGTIARTPLQLWDAYIALSSALENANRNATYASAINAGRSHAEAAYMAKDLMDFSMQGDSKFIQFFSDVLPFFNARLQGGYKLGRQAAKSGSARRRMAARGAMIALASVGLLAWNLAHYRDAYDELEEWDKDTYWHIAPGTRWHLRIPKPFEVGLAFGTIPERIAQAVLRHDSGEQSLGALYRAISGTMAINPIPQGALPLVEEWANRRFFTGRPIENQGDEQLLPEAREEWYTSDTMKLLADHVGNSTGASAKRLEHLWNGYTGGLGGYILDVSDWAARKLEDAPQRPELAMRDLPVLGRFLRGANAPAQTRYQTEFYDKLEKAEEVGGTIKEYLAKAQAGDPDALDRAVALREENRELLGEVDLSKTAKLGFGYTNVKAMRDVQQQLSALRDQADAIAESRKLSPHDKRLQIDELATKRNRLVRDTVRARADAGAIPMGEMERAADMRFRLDGSEPLPKLEHDSARQEMEKIRVHAGKVRAARELKGAEESLRATFKAQGEAAAAAELKAKREIFGDQVTAEIVNGKDGPRLVLHGLKARRDEVSE